MHYSTAYGFVFHFVSFWSKLEGALNDIATKFIALSLFIFTKFLYELCFEVGKLYVCACIGVSARVIVCVCVGDNFTTISND